MYTVLCRRKEVYPPPAHLQTKKRKNHNSTKSPARNLSENPQMDIQQVAHPSQGSPGLLRVPVPVMSPGILRPEGSGHHSQGEESQTYIYQSIHTCKYFLIPHFPTLAEQDSKREQEGATENRVGEHIHCHVRYEPRALERGHQGCIVDFRFQAVDGDENSGKHS